MMDDWVDLPNVEVFSAPQPGAIILDIRHPDEVERKPLDGGATEIQLAPFYALQNSFAKLDPGQQYLLYCDKGVMSQLHAELLKEQGYENLAVYRPGTT